MTTHKTIWTEEKTLIAAESASCLSALLTTEEFYKSGALKWLKSEHIDKFLDAINEEEANNIFFFAEGWHYKNDPIASKDFPVLDD